MTYSARDDRASELFGEVRSIIEIGWQGELPTELVLLTKRLASLDQEKYLGEYSPYLRDKTSGAYSSVTTIGEAKLLNRLFPWVTVSLDLRGVLRSFQSLTDADDTCRVCVVDARFNVFDHDAVLRLMRLFEPGTLHCIDTRHSNITFAEVSLIRELSPCTRVVCGEFDADGYALFPRVERSRMLDPRAFSTTERLFDLDEEVMLTSVDGSIASIFTTLMDGLEEHYEGAFDRFELSGQYSIDGIRESWGVGGSEILFEFATTWVSNGFVDYDDVEMTFYFQRVGDELVLRLVDDIGFGCEFFIEMWD